MDGLYIKRTIEKVLHKLVGAFPAISITGPRQSGKSTLLKQVFRNSHQYVSFDDPVNRERSLSDPRMFLDQCGENIILDEIQYVPELLSYVKMRIDEDRQIKGRFLLTGSQQFPLIRNLGDSLAGRIALMELLPFDVREKRAVPGQKEKLSTPMDCFTHAALHGSFPEPTVDPSLDPLVWYNSYMQTYLERDVRSIYNTGNLRDFQRFTQILAGRCSQILNISYYANELGVAVNTVKNWLSILEACRIIYLLRPYSGNLGKRVVKSPKVYFLDCGLVCYLTGIRSQDHLLQGPMAGPLFENYCIEQTVKAFFNKGERPPIYYLRTHNQLEIDLLIEQSIGTIYPIEVKLTKTPKPSMFRPFQRLKNIFPHLRVEQARLISLNENSNSFGNGQIIETIDSYLVWLAGL